MFRSFVCNWLTDSSTYEVYALRYFDLGDDAAPHVVGEAGDVSDAEGVGPEHGDLPGLAPVQLRHPLYLTKRDVIPGLVPMPSLIYTRHHTLTVLKIQT